MTDQPTRTYWLAVRIPESEIDEKWIGSDLLAAADRAQTVLEEHAIDGVSVWHASQPPAAAPSAGRADLRDHIADAVTGIFSSGKSLYDPGRQIADAVLAALPAPVDRAEVLRDFLWRLEQACGDAAAEQLLDQYPELRGLADEQPAPCGRGAIPAPCSAGDWCCTGPDDDEEQAPEADVTTRQCGHDDYHDGHPWHEQPHIWCPGHRIDEPAGESA